MARVAANDMRSPNPQCGAAEKTICFWFARRTISPTNGTFKSGLAFFRIQPFYRPEVKGLFIKDLGRGFSKKKPKESVFVSFGF
jgi:hypothetical protein